MNVNIADFARSWLEYRSNPLKFIHEQVKIPLPGGSTPFRPYNKQIELVENFLKYHNLVILKSRQIGVSTIVQALIAWMVVFYDNVVVGVISRDGPEATDFARKVMGMLDELDSDFKPTYEKKTEQSFILDNKSALYVGIVNPSKPGAVFRGKTLTLLVVDEAAFISNMDEAYTAIVPALLKAHDVAKQRNLPYGTIIMSTPNGMVKEGKWFYDMWKFALSHPGDPFYPQKIYWKDIPEFANNPEWYEEQKKLFKYDEKKIAQELELTFIAPSTSFLDNATCEQLQKVHVPPIRKLDIREQNRKVGELWIWRDKISEDDQVVIGVDTATAFGSSKSAVQVIEINTMEQLAELEMKAEVSTLIHVLDKIILPMYPNALVVIEANSVGNQLIEYFSKSKWMLNLYMRPVQNPRLQIREYRPGLVNDSKIRPLLIESLYTCVTNFVEGIKSERLVMQLISLEDKGGKVSGSPDDLCLAYSFVAYIRQYAKKYISATQQMSEEVEQDFVNVIADNNETINYHPVEVTNIDNKSVDDFDNIDFSAFFKVETDYTN